MLIQRLYAYLQFTSELEQLAVGNEFCEVNPVCNGGSLRGFHHVVRVPCFLSDDGEVVREVGVRLDQ